MLGGFDASKVINPNHLVASGGCLLEGGILTESVTAVTAGASYCAGLWSATARAEYRYAVATAPTTFAACTYVPTLNNTYDPAIRHICVNPKGALASGSPAPGYTIQFRARIK